jgi:hypothetical protein
MRHLYSFTDFLNEGKVEDLHAKYYSDIEPTTFHQIITADPTSIARNGETKKMGTYSKWLLKLFQDGKLLLEDLYKATEYLTMFDKLKTQNDITGATADINRYSSLPDLFKYIKLIGGTGDVSEDESYLLNDRYYINQGEVEVFHEDDDYLIVIPRTLKASQFYAHNTEWCTKYPDMFKEYSEEGDLYAIIDKRKLNTKDDNRMMQFHFQSMQFMDINDERLPPPVKVAFLSIFQHIKESWKLRYDDIGVYREGRAKVGLYNGYGFVDLDGNVVVPLKYDWVGSYQEGRTRVKLNGRWGVIDLDGNEVVPLKYNTIGYYQEGRASVELNDKYGFIDLDGKEVVPPMYDSIGQYKNGKVVVRLNDKHGYIDLDGNEVTPPKYDSVGSYYEGRARVKLDYKWGVIDLDGNEVVSPKYDWLSDYLGDRAGVVLNGKRGYIDLDGNETWD